MKSVVGVLLLSSLVTVAAAADELIVKPGLWETTTTRTNPLGGEPSTDRVQACVEGGAYDPSQLIVDVDGCDLLSNSVTDNTLRFAMKCAMQAGELDATGQYHLAGDEGTGAMDINMAMGPMKLNVKMNWVSKRLGDC